VSETTSLQAGCYPHLHYPARVSGVSDAGEGSPVQAGTAPRARGRGGSWHEANGDGFSACSARSSHAASCASWTLRSLPRRHRSRHHKSDRLGTRPRMAPGDERPAHTRRVQLPEYQVRALHFMHLVAYRPAIAGRSQQAPAGSPLPSWPASSWFGAEPDTVTTVERHSVAANR